MDALPCCAVHDEHPCRMGAVLHNTVQWLGAHIKAPQPHRPAMNFDVVVNQSALGLTGGLSLDETLFDVLCDVCRHVHATVHLIHDGRQLLFDGLDDFLRIACPVGRIKKRSHTSACRGRDIQ